jgi:hypothetical protein
MKSNNLKRCNFYETSLISIGNNLKQMKLYFFAKDQVFEPKLLEPRKFVINFTCDLGKDSSQTSALYLLLEN